MTLATHLEQYQVGICKLSSVQPRPVPARFAFEHPLEVTQKLWQSILDVVFRLPERLNFLVLVVFADGDGVVTVMGFIAESV